METLLYALLHAIIVAVLTLALERAPKVYGSWAIRRRYFALLGDNWKGFHYSFKRGKPVLIESTWKITKGYMTPFKVIWEQPELTYKGRLKLEGDDRIIVDVKAKTQNERVVFRFPNPLLSTRDIVWGLWLSYDHDKHIASGGALLTKEDLTREQAEKELKDHILCCPGQSLPIMRLNF